MNREQKLFRGGRRRLSQLASNGVKADKGRAGAGNLPGKRAGYSFDLLLLLAGY